MANHLFIFGAGASFSAGAPLMGNFLDVAQDIYTKGVAKSPEAFRNVFEAIGMLQQSHSKSQLDIINLESVFNAFEMAKLINKLGSKTEIEIEELIRSLKIVIVETLENTVAFPLTERRQIKSTSTYDSFANTLYQIRKDTNGKQHQFSFLTFNYDIALDFALEQNRIPINYCLGEPEKLGVPFLKLHGSLNWFADKNQVVHAVYPSEYFSRIPEHNLWDLEALRVQFRNDFPKFMQIYRKLDVEDIPTIIPPAWNKSNYHNSIKNVWQTASTQLSGADYIYIIGYSLPSTDAYFSLLFSLGTISKKPLRAISVINPEASTENKFRSILGPGALARFKFYARDFEDSIDILERTVRESS